MHMRGRGREYYFLVVTHGRSRTTADPRIPTMPGRSTSGFHRLGKTGRQDRQAGKTGRQDRQARQAGKTGRQDR